jgi:hypothetical protein
LVATPKVSAFPWERLPRLSRDQARTESLIASWLGAAIAAAAGPSTLSRLVKLLRIDAPPDADAAITARVTPPSPDFDPYAAHCIVKLPAGAGAGARAQAGAGSGAASGAGSGAASGAGSGAGSGAELVVRGSSTGVIALANKILGGPAELAAPRPVNVVEQSIWCLVVATALEDLGVSGIVWPASSGNRTKSPTRSSSPTLAGATARSTTAAQRGGGLGAQSGGGLGAQSDGGLGAQMDGGLGAQCVSGLGGR